MRRSILIGKNVSNCIFSKFGTIEKYNFQTPKTIKMNENIKINAFNCFQIDLQQRESVFRTCKYLHRIQEVQVDLRLATCIIKIESLCGKMKKVLPWQIRVYLPGKDGSESTLGPASEVSLFIMFVIQRLVFF